jgi:hypothetical protein
VHLSWCIAKAAYFVFGLLSGSQDGYSNQQEEKGVFLGLSSCSDFVSTYACSSIVAHILC